jgi:holin-like protein
VSGLARAWRLVRQALLLTALYYAGTAAVTLAHLPVPGNLAGLGLLWLLLETGVVPSEALTELATPALRHLGLLFLPFVVGIMAWPALIAASGVLLGASLIGSALLGLAVTGLVAQAASRKLG